MKDKVITLVNDNHEVKEKMGFSFSILFTGPLEMFKNLDIVRGTTLIAAYILIFVSFSLNEWYIVI